MNNRVERTRKGIHSVAVIALASIAAAFASRAAAQEAPQAESAQDALAASVSLSNDKATLTLALPDGATRTIRLEAGTLFIDGVKRATYEPGGTLDAAWRALLRSPAVFSAEGLAEALRTWSPPAGADEAAAEMLEASLQAVTAGGPAANVAEEAAAVAEEVQMEGPNGGVSIAPGRLSFDELDDRLDRLRSSLDRLGEDASHADDDLALIVHDSYRIAADRVVEGNLALLDGELDLDGTIEGHVLVLDGVLNLLPNAVIEGDILQVGGDVQHEGGHLGGELLSIVSLDPPAAAVAPEVRVRVPSIHVVEHTRGGFFGSIYRNFDRAMHGLGTTLGWFIGLGLAGLGLVYFTRPRLETVADTARHQMARSFAIGLAGEVLFFPISLILVVAVITWLLIPFYAIAVVLALIGGYLAVAHAAGEILAARRFRSELLERLRRSNSYYYVLSGLAFLLIPFALVSVLWVFGGPLSFLRGLTMFVACVITWAATTLGFGAVILSRGGTRTEHAGGAYGAYTGRVPFASKKEDIA